MLIPVIQADEILLFFRLWSCQYIDFQWDYETFLIKWKRAVRNCLHFLKFFMRVLILIIFVSKTKIIYLLNT